MEINVKIKTLNKSNSTCKYKAVYWQNSRFISHRFIDYNK